MLSSPSMFNAPEVQASAMPADDYMQPTLSHGLRVWWAYFWPTSLISGILIAVLKAALLLAYKDVLISASAVVWLSRILAYVFTYGVAFFTIRYLLAKRFRHFRIALLPRDPAAGRQPLPRSFQRTGRVWWAFSWRCVVYYLILIIVSAVSLGYVFAFLAELGRAMAILTPLLQALLYNAAVGLYVMYSNVLDEEFADFRVALLPRLPAAAPAPAEVAAPESAPL